MTELLHESDADPLDVSIGLLEACIDPVTILLWNGKDSPETLPGSCNTACHLLQIMMPFQCPSLLVHGTIKGMAVQERQLHSATRLSVETAGSEGSKRFCNSQRQHSAQLW